MNILFISHEASYSGAPLALLNLLKELKRRASTITFTVLQLKGGPLTSDFKHLCPVITLPDHPWKIRHLFKQDTLRDRLAIRLLLFHLKRQHFELIYANTMETLATAICLKRHLTIPLLLHSHEAFINQCSLNTPKSWIRACDRFIAVSPLAQHCLTALGADASKINTVFPTSAFTERLMAEKNPPQAIKKSISKTVIGYVGPFLNRKGADLLPIVMKRLHDVHPNFNFEIQSVGNFRDIERKRVEYDIRRLGMADRLRFIEPLADPISAYTDMDLLLVLSREESFSLVVVEFGLLGKPVIIFDGSCGVQHFLKNEQDAIIVPYLDIDGIAEAIYMLSQDREKCRQLGENLRKVMRNHYLQTDTNEEIIKILSSFNSSN